jgi:hypothetical protein
MSLLVSSRTLRASDAIAGGNAPGLNPKVDPDPEGVAQSHVLCDPFRVGLVCTLEPWALPPAITYHAFGVNHSLPPI